MADFLTIDVYRDPVRRTPARRRLIRAALANPLPTGLRAHTINHANTGTFTIIPQHYGTCLLLAWESRDAAHAAWHGRLGAALVRAGDFRLDGEVARARTEHGDDHWHGWRPADDGSTPIAKDEPMVVLVHGIVRPAAPDDVPARRRPRGQPRSPPPRPSGSIDVHAKPPFENTSISIWSTRRSAQDFAYQPGGHAPAMQRARELDTHWAGVYLQVLLLASTGSLGIDDPALPELPDADR